MEIDPELERTALAEALERFPSMREHAPSARLRFMPLPGGSGAFMLRYEPPLPPGLADAWEFQNAVVRAYKRLAGDASGGGACSPSR